MRAILLLLPFVQLATSIGLKLSIGGNSTASSVATTNTTRDSLNFVPLRKKILIIYTGGTIGMKRTPEGFAPAKGYMAEKLKHMSGVNRPEMPAWELDEYDPIIDSSDASPNDWMRIANDISENYDKFDGFLVLHGTDTMAYTASALSFMLEGLTKPVVITGSQIPLAELRTDGKNNLINALYVVAEYPMKEVALLFNNKLLRGCRVTKASADGFDAFHSPNFPPLLTAGVNIKVEKGIVEQVKWFEHPLTVTAITPQPIIVITLFPGLPIDTLRVLVKQPLRAIVMRTFGAGNAPTNDKFLGVMKEAYKNNIIIVNISQCGKGMVNMGTYAAGSTLARVGVVSGGDMTVEAVVGKLQFLMSKGLDTERVRQLMTLSIRGERSDVGPVPVGLKF
eukprot:GHVN01060685.1.p1 GENE.GHVN01060685.1~~GHVN01060685.1.p1  ORF type:complete len:394 (+),score=46.19 GHVN01060685.1:66-1247(+)